MNRTLTWHKVVASTAVVTLAAAGSLGPIVDAAAPSDFEAQATAAPGSQILRTTPHSTAPAASDNPCTASDSPTEVTLVLAGPNAAVIPVQPSLMAFGIQEGLFDAVGIVPKIAYSANPTESLQAVAAGQADIANSEPAAVFKARTAGVDAVGLSRVTLEFPWMLVTPPGSSIVSAADLDGKKLGVISPTSGSATYARAVLNQNGLSDDDVELVPVGFAGQAGEALRSGAVDALAYYASGIQELRNAGFELAVVPQDSFYEDVANQVFVTTESKLAEDGPAMACFLQAYFASVVLANAAPEASAAAGIEVYPDILGGKSADEVLPTVISSLEGYLATVVPQSGEPESWEFGVVTEEQWDTTLEYERLSSGVEYEAPYAEGWDADMVDTINAFDMEAVLALGAERAGD